MLGLCLLCCCFAAIAGVAAMFNLRRKKKSKASRSCDDEYESYEDRRPKGIVPPQPEYTTHLNPEYDQLLPPVPPLTMPVGGGTMVPTFP